MTPNGVTFVLLLVLTLAGCQPAETRQITARTYHVLRVVDGDTFKVRYDGDVVSVRLWGIDAPEMNTAAGPGSRAALAKLIDDKEVRLVFCADKRRDNFGRLLARVFVGVPTDSLPARGRRTGLEVGPEMIRLGHAKPYGRGKMK